MNDRNISWRGTVSEETDYGQPIAFSKRRLEAQSDLFAHRSALFFTSTEDIPDCFVGAGVLDITLPVPSPDYNETFANRSLMIPRFWVDLIQRQTFKIRWRPFLPARVVFTRFDYHSIREDHLRIGQKGLLDALKVRTSGRSDGRTLHYFGAIVDDAPDFVDVECHQELVSHPSEAKIKVLVTAGEQGEVRAGRARDRGIE